MLAIVCLVPTSASSDYRAIFLLHPLLDSSAPLDSSTLGLPFISHDKALITLSCEDLTIQTTFRGSGLSQSRSTTTRHPLRDDSLSLRDDDTLTF
ncbi:hypothetical protein OC842_007495 [Tilletia horrida]|uniref:Uncharacterized protein n=1 Tax=Tilletia horrida TaxID=155126 RepID=A0AAN6JGP0_9BASI|nr:hypothetical protein OC842_007495 [Tilletia horrida]